MARWVMNKVVREGVAIPSEGTQIRMALCG